MKNRIAPLIALTIALGTLEASAQGTAALPVPPESAEPPQTAPQVAPGPPAAPQIYAQAIDLALYADYVVQATRRSRQIDQLYAVMNREGDEFSQEKYESYDARRTGGVVLIVLGGASVFASMITGITLDTGSSSSDDYEDGDSTDDERSSLLPGLPLGLLFGGIGSIAIGLPLTISGARGKRRQEILRRKDEILAPYDPSAVFISFYVDPERGSGGIQMKMTF
jgi:hypothetical protein